MKSEQLNLLSSVSKKGAVVTQLIHFIGGTKKVFEGVKTETIRQGQFTHFELEDGRTIMINDRNVLIVEVFKK